METTIAQNPKSLWPRALWALFGSCMVTVGIVAALRYNDRCLFTFWSRNTAVGWLIFMGWLAALFFLRWKGKTILIVAAMVAAMVFLPVHESSPVAVGESEAARDLRQIQVSLTARGGNGYPENLSPTLTKDFAAEFYRITYTPRRATPDGPAVGFLLKATATRPDCGPRRSFATSEKGEMHSTRERREAELTDDML